MFRRSLRNESTDRKRKGKHRPRNLSSRGRLQLGQRMRHVSCRKVGGIQYMHGRTPSRTAAHRADQHPSIFWGALSAAFERLQIPRMHDQCMLEQWNDPTSAHVGGRPQSAPFVGPFSFRWCTRLHTFLPCTLSPFCLFCFLHETPWQGTWQRTSKGTSVGSIVKWTSTTFTYEMKLGKVGVIHLRPCTRSRL